MVLLQRQSRVERDERHGVLPAIQQQPTTFNVVVDLVRTIRILALDRLVEVIEGEGRFVAFQAEPGPQTIEVGQPWFELDGAIQLFEGQVQLVQPVVCLGQVDIGLVRVRLPLDRRFQLGDGVFVSLLPDAQNPAIDREHIAGILIERQLRGLLEVRIRRAPRLQFLVERNPAADKAKQNRSAERDRRRARSGPRRASPGAEGKSH